MFVYDHITFFVFWQKVSKVKNLQILFIGFYVFIFNHSEAQKLVNPNFRFYIDEEFKYEFEINNDQPKKKLKIDVEYFWFESGIIQSSFYDYAGKVLHGSYQKLTSNGYQLIEKGDFDYGIKKGHWKYWFPNGKLKKREYWKKGKLHGVYEEFDKKGIRIRGTYRKGLKHGIWVDFIKKTQHRYHKGKIISKKLPFWKRFF